MNIIRCVEGYGSRNVSLWPVTCTTDYYTQPLRQCICNKYHARPAFNFCFAINWSSLITVNSIVSSSLFLFLFVPLGKHNTENHNCRLWTTLCGEVPDLRHITQHSLALSTALFALYADACLVSSCLVLSRFSSSILYRRYLTINIPDCMKYGSKFVSPYNRILCVEKLIFWLLLASLWAALVSLSLIIILYWNPCWPDVADPPAPGHSVHTVYKLQTQL